MFNFIKKSVSPTCFLSESIELDGVLESQGSIRVDGTVKGKLESNATIFIGQDAKIKAEIITHSLVSNGNFEGNLMAEDNVLLQEKASLKGHIRTCYISVAKGVFFDGSCEILKPKDIGHPKLLNNFRPPRKAIAHRA